jgi:AraC-like DNA-binding protein
VYVEAIPPANSWGRFGISPPAYAGREVQSERREFSLRNFAPAPSSSVVRCICFARQSVSRRRANAIKLFILNHHETYQQRACSSENKLEEMKKSLSRKKPESIIPQAKLLRLFQIIAVLKSGHWTIKQMADRFDTSERTIYRYLKLLEEVDFLIEKDFDNRYFIITSEDDPTQSQFSVEETRLIKKLILAGANDNPLKNILLKKLSLNSEIDSMPRLFLKARLGKFVDQLAEAIKEKEQVVLKNYHSA